MDRKRIAIVTTGRQDWGILRSVALRLGKSDDFAVSILAGGMACSDEFGNIANSIENQGFSVERITWDVASNLSPIAQIVQALPRFERVCDKIAPDAVLLLGDRFETLSIAQATVLMKIPIIHLHGGEETEGALDNQFRHAITKLSHIHFVSCEEHARRVIQMGENSANVHIVGAPGLDNINRDDLMDINDVLGSLKIEKCDGEPVFLITYHPATLLGNTRSEIQALIAALSSLDHGVCLFTMPNNDPDGEIIRAEVKRFVARKPKKRVAVAALGEKRYWSVLKSCDLVAGNSSSGIIEAPAVPVPVVNIGLRQKGRKLAPCVINIEQPDEGAILTAIKKGLSTAFKNNLTSADSPFGNGKSADKIYNVLQKVDFKALTSKRWYVKSLSPK